VSTALPERPETGLAARLLRRLQSEFASRLARDTLAVLLFSGLGRGIALGKEMLVAALFGVGGLLDAYVLAFLIPSLLVNMLGASFASALIPALGGAEAKASGAEAGTGSPGTGSPGTGSPGTGARGLLARALPALGLAIGLATLCLWLLPVQALRALAPTLAPERLALLKTMQTALLPVFVLGSLSQVLAACVNYRGNFKGPALASTLGALTTILVMALLHGRLGVQALVAGVDAGAALECALLAGLAWRAWARAQTHGPAETLGQAPRTPLRPLLKDWGLLALGAAMLAVASFVDNLIASTLGEGAVSALNYAWKLPSGFATLLGLTLSTVLLPYFTGLVHNAPAGEMRRACRRIVSRLLLVCAPLAAAGALASPLLVTILFQRGRFDAQAADLVSLVQACYFVQLPFYLLAIATQRMLQALSRFRFLLLLQTALLVVNALTSYLLSRVVGVAGIAISSAIMYALYAGLSLLAVERRFKEQRP